MEKEFQSFASLTDRQLLEQAKTLALRECHVTASLIALLAEIDARKLYLAEGFSSLFAYCIDILQLTEHAAYSRIEVARTARMWPVIFELIADGSVTVTSVRLLSASLTEGNHRELLAAAVHKTKREVEKLVAALRPQPPVPSIVRKLPAPKPVLFPASQPGCTEAVTPPAPVVSSETICEPPPAPIQPHRRAAVVAPLAPERYKVQMTVSRETHDKLRRVQDLMRHQVPDGDLAAVFDRALTLLLQDLERRRLADTNRPRPARTATPGSRHVPAAVRREVWKRDGGQCAFTGNAGRCSERGFLEFHHVVPFADGGPATAANIQLRCRSHNAYEAEERFGPLLVREKRAEYDSFQDRVQCWQHRWCSPPT
jgi:hypothetical protein